jgi:hypothetical protein
MARSSSFGEPHYLGADLVGNDMGKDHYESVGTIAGTLNHDGRQVLIQCFGFQDHSWGTRDLSRLLTTRYISATVGSDLSCAAYAAWTAAGRSIFGYVFDGGRYYRLSEAKFECQIADDGHTPTKCVADLWTEEGRGYRVTGVGDVGHVSSHDGDYFVTDVFATFEMGGRLGGGLIECR